jgi:hypothetical protein
MRAMSTDTGTFAILIAKVTGHSLATAISSGSAATCQMAFVRDAERMQPSAARWVVGRMPKHGRVDVYHRHMSISTTSKALRRHEALLARPAAPIEMRSAEIHWATIWVAFPFGNGQEPQHRALPPVCIGGHGTVPNEQ